MMNEAQESVVLNAAADCLVALRTAARIAEQHMKSFEDAVARAAQAVSLYNETVEGIKTSTLLDMDMPESVQIDASTGALTESLE